MLFTVGLLSLGFGKGPHIAFACYVSLVSYDLVSPQALTRCEDGSGVLQKEALHSGFPHGRPHVN